MTDIVDLLKQDELTLEEMCTMTKLPRQMFNHFFGDTDLVKLNLYNKDTGRMEDYRFQREKKQGRTYYINQGYAPPLP